jgi:uncharacterized protein (DUF305 family)
MARTRVVLALTTMLVLAACGRAAATDPAAANLNANDVRFLHDMISDHKQAIEMATMVNGRSRRPQLIRFATGLAATRQAEISVMERWLTRHNQPAVQATATDDGSPLPGLQGPGQLAWLKLLRGPRFDLGFVTMMDTHHGGVVEIANTELQAGASAEVKALARRIVTAQAAEMRQLHRWKDAWSSDAGQPTSG